MVIPFNRQKNSAQQKNLTKWIVRLHSSVHLSGTSLIRGIDNRKLLLRTYGEPFDLGFKGVLSYLKDKVRVRLLMSNCKLMGCTLTTNKPSIA